MVNIPVIFLSFFYLLLLFLKIIWCGPFLKSLLNLLQYCFCFMFWSFGPETCGIPAPRPGIKPAPPALEGKVPTNGLPGKPLIIYLCIYLFVHSNKTWLGTFLAVQWLRPRASTAGGTGLIPVQGTKIPHAAQCGQKNPKTETDQKKIWLRVPTHHGGQELFLGFFSPLQWIIYDLQGLSGPRKLDWGYAVDPPLSGQRQSSPEVFSILGREAAPQHF